MTGSEAPLRGVGYEVREWVTKRGAEWRRGEDADRDGQYEFDSFGEALNVLELPWEEEDPARRRDHLFSVRMAAEQAPLPATPARGRSMTEKAEMPTKSAWRVWRVRYRFYECGRTDVLAPTDELAWATVRRRADTHGDLRILEEGMEWDDGEEPDDLTGKHVADLEWEPEPVD